MINYEDARVEFTNDQLKKTESAAKNKTETPLKLLRKTSR